MLFQVRNHPSYELYFHICYSYKNNKKLDPYKIFVFFEKVQFLTLKSTKNAIFFPHCRTDMKVLPFERACKTVLETSKIFFGLTKKFRKNFQDFMKKSDKIVKIFDFFVIFFFRTVIRILKYYDSKKLFKLY